MQAEHLRTAVLDMDFSLVCGRLSKDLGGGDMPTSF